MRPRLAHEGVKSDLIAGLDDADRKRPEHNHSRQPHTQESSFPARAGRPSVASIALAFAL